MLCSWMFMWFRIGTASGMAFSLDWDCFLTFSRIVFIFFTSRNATMGVRWLMFNSRVEINTFVINIILVLISINYLILYSFLEDLFLMSIFLISLNILSIWLQIEAQELFESTVQFDACNFRIYGFFADYN